MATFNNASLTARHSLFNYGLLVRTHVRTNNCFFKACTIASPLGMYVGVAFLFRLLLLHCGRYAEVGRRRLW